MVSKGIYCFIDKKYGVVVYIGRFSGRQRINEHYHPSRYDDQQINRVLQNNPDRYEVKIICEYPDLTNDELNYLEIKEILKYKFLYDKIPKFNFTIGGEGMSGWTHTEESKQLMSKNNARYWKGKTQSPEHRKKNSDANKGEKNHEWKNYARIIKKGFDKNKQRYAIRYNGKNLKHSVHIHKLYKWFAKNYPNEYLYLEIE